MDITLALQSAVRGCSLGTAAVAAAMGMRSTTLCHKVSPTYDAQFCSPEEMLRIMEITGNDAPLVALADARNYALVPLPHRGEEGGEEVCTRLMLSAVKEFAHVAEAVTASVDPAGPGGVVIKDSELARIEQEGAEAIAAIQALMAWAARRNQESKPVALRPQARRA